jgi:uncharacterized membrane protein
LKRYRLPERLDIVADVRGHVAEAVASGRSLESVLESMGPAEALARAFVIELVAQPPTERPSGLMRRIGIIVRRIVVTLGLLIASGLATLIMTIVFGLVGASLVATGFASAVIGVAELAGWHIPGTRIDAPFTPLSVIALGPVVFAIGCAALWVLWRYARFLARALLSSLRGAQSAPSAFV